MIRNHAKGMHTYLDRTLGQDKWGSTTPGVQALSKQ